ncbi:MAG TPA: phage holin family protein [Burkholderiaceae bacterium]|jgi:putative membrane protein|nr:phage holin family protein [Burkholderiaceae bacterium]
MQLLLHWILNALALMIVAHVVPGISVRDPITALVAAVLLGLANAVIKPLLVLLTLPVTILTLGLFLLVINGLLFWAVSGLMSGFEVHGFWTGVLGAFIYSLLTALLSLLVRRQG